ncbi:hypothetical protein GCM10008014_08310 [Paenibacillus silvae]|uniref:Exo-alpha-sialidase n=1 Tax=Paenibacillus silvae TaxID=1325358 RepID=A0ABQ1Z353_9BACL|nr:hypothetical protein [Paenibacillus silvae]GGH45954.1 hypothetical protein GCM10008014_08310 [Paenibacillus silvae]
MPSYWDKEGKLVDFRVSIVGSNDDGSSPSQIVSSQRTVAFLKDTPMSANAQYTSPTIDVLNYTKLFIRAFADANGVFSIQSSDDGITWDISASYNVVAGTVLFAPVVNGLLQLQLRYIRVVYTNSTTAQTIFRFSGYLSPM